MTGGTPDGTPKDTNGEGRWRLQTVERETSALRSELNVLSREFAVHQQQTKDHNERAEKRWQEEDRRRRDEEREFDDWKEAQERKLDFVRKVAVAALVAFVAASFAGIINAVILVASS